MAWDDGHVAVEGVEAVTDRPDDQSAVATPEVGATDAARKKRVPGEEHRSFPGKPEANGAGSVAWRMQDFDGCSPFPYDLRVRQEPRKRESRRHGHPKQLGLLGQILVEKEVSLMKVHPGPHARRHRRRAADVIEMGVSVDQCDGPKAMRVQTGADLVGLVSGIDDQGVPRVGIAQNCAIAPEHSDGKGLDEKGGWHGRTIARQVVKILPMRPSTLITLFFAFFAALVGPAVAQDTQVSVKSAKVEGAEVVLTVSVEGGWHIYAVNVGDKETRTRFTVVDGPATFQGEVKEPLPKHKKQTFEGSDYVQEYDYHEGQFVFRIPFVAKGTGKVKARVDYVACTDESCLPPAFVEWTFDVVASGATAPAGAQAVSTKVPSPESATPKRSDDPVKVSSLTYTKTGTVGVPSLVEIDVEIDEGWHIYALDPKTEIATPTRFDLVETPGKGAPKAKVDKERIMSLPLPEDHTGESPYSGHTGSVTFKVPVLSNEAGKQTWRFRFRYQACDAKSCLPPASFTYDMEVEVAASTAVPIPTPPPTPDANTTSKPATRASTSTPLSNPLPETQPTKPARFGSAALATATVEPGATTVLTLTIPGALPTGSASLVMEAPFLRVVGPPSLTKLANGDTQVVATLEVSPDAREAEFDLNGRLEVGGVKVDFTGRSAILSTLLGFIFLAIASAGLALLTPCVFPMIPVTISYFTKQSGGKPIRLGLLYCFGIVASFTLIGVIFTSALGGQGATVFAQHWITQAAIGILFIVFAASLFGGFEMQLPSWVLNMAGSAQSRGGSAGILLMGALFSITTFTCTAAFVGGLLAEAATTGSWTRPLIGMVVFSSVLAAPFFFLSAFPSLVKSLPRSGGWMNEVKVVMGFIEVVAATKFLNGGFPTLFPRTVCIVICVAAFLAMGLYLIGTYRLPHDSLRERTPVTGLFLSMSAFAFSFYLATGLDGTPLNPLIDGYLPAVEAQKDPEHRQSELVEAIKKSVGTARVSMSGAHGERLGMEARFKDDYEGAVAAASAANVPLFIDFTGFTCQNCRTVESVVFRNKEIKALFEKFVVVELHCDHPTEALAKKHLDLEERMVRAITQPYYVVIDPKDERQYGAWAFDLSIESWKSKLEDALSRHAARAR